MRIAAAIGAVILLVGLGLAARYFATDDGTSLDLTDLPTPQPQATSPETSDAGGQVAQTPPLPPAQPEGSDLPPLPGQDGTSGTQPQQNATESAPMMSEEEGPLRFSMPLDCPVYGEDCYILNYVNAGLETDPRDYSCGSLTYADHRGTDFRLLTERQMQAGVSVLAAAPGTVEQAHDGMPDANYRLFGRAAVADRGLGNRVVIDHGDGIKTIYGHLKRGSVAVSAGDVVARGQMIGQVGMSGLTEFPHVHFEVSELGSFVDPFTSALRHEGCGLAGDSMWQPETLAKLRYLRTVVIRSGFADETLNRAAVEYGLFNNGPISANATALVLHVYVAGIQEGDAFVAEITDPTGARFVKSGSAFSQFRQSRLFAIGKQDLIDPLVPGIYTGEFRYYRKDASGEPVLLLTVNESVEVR